MEENDILIDDDMKNILTAKKNNRKAEKSFASKNPTNSCCYSVER